MKYKESNRLSLLFFIPSFSGGGLEKVMWELAKGLCKEFKITIASASGEYSEEYTDDLAGLIEIKKISIPTGYGLFFLSVLPLSKELKTNKYDVIICFGTQANIIGLMSKNISNSESKLIATEHNMLSIRTKNKGIKKKITLNLARYFYNKADSIVAVSKGVSDDLKNTIGINTDKVIYNPVVSNKLIENSKIMPTHPWLMDKKTPVILGVGRLVEQKRFDRLIQAFSIAVKKQKLRMIILGEGQERQNLEELIKKLNLESQIDLPGHSVNPYSYMASSDVFVLSSDREGLGNVLIEALACGINVVSTDCPSGPSEILENGKWGSLVPLDDYQGLANAITESIDSDQPIENLRKRADCFRVSVAVSEYTQVINNLVC